MKNKSAAKARGERPGGRLRHHFGIRSASAEGDRRVVRSLQTSHINLRKLNVHERELTINYVRMPNIVAQKMCTKVCTKSYISIFVTFFNDLHSNKDE